MSEQPSDWEMHFTLSEKIDCEDELSTRNDVEFETTLGKSEQKSITGFTIKVNNVLKIQAEEVSREKAHRLTDFLSTTSGTASIPHLDGTRVKKPTGGYTVSRTWTMSYNIRNNAGMGISKQKLEGILENSNSVLSQQMKYVNRAIHAIKNRDPASAIKELVLACNENPQGNLRKYKPLRNALSHDTPELETIQRVQRDFGLNYFEFTSERRFNFSSDKNMKNLTIEANKFLQQVREELKEKI